MKLVDTHCHVLSEYYDDIDKIIQNARDNGVCMMIVNGVDRKSNEEVLQLVKKYDVVYGALGIQPEEIEKMKEDDLLFLKKHLNDDKIVAVGEIGLDYHCDVSRKLQEDVFRKQLEIAEELKKPVIIHSRDCIKETYEIVKDYNVIGSMHCYSGDVVMAEKFVELGFKLGIGGICTFKNGGSLREVIKNISLEYIVLETDSPYLSPEPYRGERNEPRNVGVILQKICDIKGISKKDASLVTTRNAFRLFDKHNEL